MNRFAEGDLDSHIEISSDDSFARLFTGFNKAVNNFHKIILNLLEAIKSTAAASDQININAEKIHKGTVEQSLRSEEVASAVQQMTENIYHSSKNSENAAKASIDAKKMAADGGEIVKKTIGSMSEISNVIINAAETIKKLGESSNQISEIVELIEDVADQTNLLALNAAIEAARAGEHGRGFAVVADEVKKLSERTTSATKNIAGMIKRIQTESKGAINSISSGMDKVKSGQQYAEQAGVSLDKIIVSVTEVSDLIEQVAAANEEQSATAEHISESVVTISSVSKDNAAGVEQVTTAIEDLRKLTADLEKLIHKFELGKERHPEEFVLENRDSF